MCVVAGLAAYALARLDVKGGSVVLGYLLFGTALPAQLFLVPLFVLWSNLGLYDTRIGLVIIYWAIFSPFATLLMRSYLVSLPADYEDAARTDGANELQIMSRVMLPLAWPGLLTVALVADWPRGTSSSSRSRSSSRRTSSRWSTASWRSCRTSPASGGRRAPRR